MTTIAQLEERIRVLRRGIEAHVRAAHEVADLDPEMVPHEVSEGVEDIEAGLRDLLQDDDLAASLAKVPA